MHAETLLPLSDVNRNDLIQDRLKSYILQNRLQPGDKLPTEEMLAERLGVSRTAVREALRSLQALGLVEARQGFGRVVCDFNFQAILNNLSYGLAFQNRNILQVTEIRKALDSFFIEQAIANLSEADIAELAGAVARMAERSAQGLDISEEDHRFHALLYRAAGNPLAEQLFEIAWAVRLHAIDQDRVLKETPPGTAHEHAAILEAIRARDAARARELILAHHQNVERRFRDRIDEEAARQGDKP